MAFARINYHSRSLQKAPSVSLVFPDDPEIPRPYSVFYLLHGLSDDDTIWMRRTSIERYVEGLPLVVVMPVGGRGFYTNAVIGRAYVASAHGSDGPTPQAGRGEPHEWGRPGGWGAPPAPTSAVRPMEVARGIALAELEHGGDVAGREPSGTSRLVASNEDPQR